MEFKQKCYSLLKKVPEGKVTTYKEIAKALGTKAFRAVGNAMNENRDKKVPCHRVVKSNGFIGGFVYGEKMKIKMLRKEGIRMDKNKVIGFKGILYKFGDKV